MRIISGKYKGKRLQAPKKLPVRPTTDMAKEALFNILNNHYHFDEIAVLDLFAGTGNISFEFASRGTENIVSVDKDHGCIKFIASVSRELDLNIKAFKEDVYKFLEKNRLQFDIIFADPPYQFGDDDFKRLVALVFGNELLREGGMLVVEHSKFTDLSGLPWYTEERRYGGSVFSFFQANNPEK
ncbi:16S rRNA (guanine(966)-N(2))-methyltransferase RsmD [Lentiprolixibacter aurantiacus]|uniref:16S rRNA (Guanine(966)-N(2))-methyltransferase RsmD n=1 Tax=Lentiprolixibacter aurantiacus TaxID=2993939 RepID=A0AAE3MM57_9FLAO|nr:16S rRNA (guanine(966)-N(2))-methyltransferase RsmD [Lentiprolixibacter aurantiacus]MCX2719953.1 16S rRNA (guanine(966)-N(2))-methyltransferase RsmD [Lentiprolixibacter aurantiacus]